MGDSLAPSLKASRVEAAFWRAVATGEHRIGDVESALDLLLARGFVDLVKVGTASDSLSIEGMDEAMEKLVAATPGSRTATARAMPTWNSQPAAPRHLRRSSGTRRRVRIGRRWSLDCRRSGGMRDDLAL